MLEEAAAIKKFEYSLLSKEMKKQTSVAEKQDQEFDSTFESNKNQEYETKNEKGLASSNLVYNNCFTFYKYLKINEFVKSSLDSKLNDLDKFKYQLELFYHDSVEIKPNNKEQIKDFKKRKVVLTTAHKLYDKLLNIY